MTKRTCTIHASGVFSLFSALAFATRGHTVRKVVFFDYRSKFGSLDLLVEKIQPILDVFSIDRDAMTYVTHENEVVSNIPDIYSVDDSRVVFAESLQSGRVQNLLRLLGPEQIHFYAEGAMSFGPIRNGLPADLSLLLHSVHYVDYAGLRPLALKQFKASDAGMSKEDFRAMFLRLFDVLDTRYRDLTEIDAFMGSAPKGGVVIVHQNLSAMAGFDAKTEREIFTGIQRQVVKSWPGETMIFMHPKGFRNVPDIFDVDLRNAGGRACVFVAPPFPMAEYYIHKVHPKLCVGIFSSGLLNMKILGIPVLTLESHNVGHRIKSAFDSNIYALHLAQLALGSYEHDGFLYPSVNLDRLTARLLDNEIARCADKTTRLWELPFFLGDTKELASNIHQAHADYSSLSPYRTMPAFRRLSPFRKELLARATLTPAEVRKRALERRAMKAYKRVKGIATSILRRKKT